MMFYRRVSFALGSSSQPYYNYLSFRGYAVKQLPWCAPPGDKNRNNQSEATKESTPNNTSEKSPTNNNDNKNNKPIDQFGIIGAMSTNRVIGLNGKLPWKSPRDRQNFKDTTKNSILIIGRATFQEDPLLRHIAHASTTIVVSKSMSTIDSLTGNDLSPSSSIKQKQQQQQQQHYDIQLATSFPNALILARNILESNQHNDITDDKKQRQDTNNNDNISSIKCWVAGGERLYHEALLHPNADCLHLTVVDINIDVTSSQNNNYQSVAKFPAKYRWDNKFRMLSKEEYTDNDLCLTKYVYKRLRGRR